MIRLVLKKINRSSSCTSKTNNDYDRKIMHKKLILLLFFQVPLIASKPGQAIMVRPNSSQSLPTPAPTIADQKEFLDNKHDNSPSQSAPAPLIPMPSQAPMLGSHLNNINWPTPDPTFAPVIPESNARPSVALSVRSSAPIVPFSPTPAQDVSFKTDKQILIEEHRRNTRTIRGIRAKRDEEIRNGCECPFGSGPCCCAFLLVGSVTAICFGIGIAIRSSDNQTPTVPEIYNSSSSTGSFSNENFQVPYNITQNPILGLRKRKPKK